MTAVVLVAFLTVWTGGWARAFYVDEIARLDADIARRRDAEVARHRVDVDPVVAVDLLLWDLEVAQ